MSGAQIDVHEGVRRNRIRRNSAMHHSHVEGGAGPPARTARREKMNGCCQSVDGIGPPKVRPAMATRPHHADPEAAACQSLMRDPTKSSAVDRDELALACRPGRRFKQMPHAAKIALALLADISDGNHRPEEPQTRLPRRA